MTKNERAQETKREKRKLMIQNVVIVCIVVGVFGFFIWSATSELRKPESTTYYVDNQTLSDYMTDVTSETEAK